MEHQVEVTQYTAQALFGSTGRVSRQESEAAALIWLRREFIGFAVTSEVDLPGCTAAIYNDHTQEVVSLWRGSCDELAETFSKLTG